MLAVQLFDVQIQEEGQVGHEEDERTSVGHAVEPEGEEEVAAAHDDDGAVYLDLASERYDLDELIDRQCCEQQKQRSQAEWAVVGAEHLYGYDADRSDCA